VLHPVDRARAGLGELRWLQQVAERLQKAYAEEDRTPD